LHLMALPLNQSLPVNNKKITTPFQSFEHFSDQWASCWTFIQAPVGSMNTSSAQEPYDLLRLPCEEVLPCGSPPPALEACDESCKS
jgi:hypothetical protein